MFLCSQKRIETHWRNGFPRLCVLWSQAWHSHYPIRLDIKRCVFADSNSRLSTRSERSLDKFLEDSPSSNVSESASSWEGFVRGKPGTMRTTFLIWRTSVLIDFPQYYLGTLDLLFIQLECPIANSLRIVLLAVALWHAATHSERQGGYLQPGNRYLLLPV